MWTCQCNYKNVNSSKSCHNKNCELPKPLEVIKLEQEKFEQQYVRDYCPKCKSFQDFKKVKKKNYTCPRCHKLFKFSGKPTPEAKNDTNILNIGVGKFD